MNKITKRILEKIGQPGLLEQLSGLDRVLITCTTDNIASANTIEECGGKLENEVKDESNIVFRRYWLSIR